MSTQPAVLQTLINGTQDAHVYAWTLGTGDNGAPIQVPESPDRSVQFTGSFGGGTAVCEGSLDGVNYETLRDPFGNLLSFTGPGLKGISELVRSIRPSLSGGAAGAVVAYILVKKAR